MSEETDDRDNSLRYAGYGLALFVVYLALWAYFTIQWGPDF